VGPKEKVFRLSGPGTLIIDGLGRTVIPGLNDSHMHPIRGGLNYNMESAGMVFRLLLMRCGC
jgi:predicted amidohydrolase YtcJ